MFSLCVFCVTLSQITCYKGSLPLDCKISLPVHSTSRMLPGWRLPTNWSCTTGQCTLYSCTHRLYSDVHTGAKTIQVWSKTMIYNWELFRYITQSSTNAHNVKAFSIWSFDEKLVAWDFVEWNGKCRFHSSYSLTNRNRHRLLSFHQMFRFMRGSPLFRPSNNAFCDEDLLSHTHSDRTMLIWSCQ